MVKIITDSTAGLPVAFARQYDIPVIPQIIHFGDQSFQEGIDIDNAGFLQRLLASRELPKTAAPPPELFIEQFKKLVPLGQPILCIHPTAEASGTIRSVTLARAEFPHADIRIIDTRVIGSPLSTLVTLAAQWAAAGEDADTIESRLRAMIPVCHVYFIVPTLEYLARGGRIGGAAALIGSILQIKPILALHDGRVDVLERERTQKRALARLKELVYAKAPHDASAYVSVMHAAVPDQALTLANEIGAHLGIHDIPILDVPPAIIVHGGPGILAIAYFSKS